MLALAFTFPAGRYHATPWERHVNEGAVVWPPEPWRVLRALIATWHHKVKPFGKHEESTLRSLIEALSQELPEYALPAASHSHTRHYMPQREIAKTSLVFDAFIAVPRDKKLIMAWRNLELPQQQAALLDDLLAVMGYLGRAESWVEASRFDGAFQPNCRPENSESGVSSGKQNEELTTLLAPLPVVDYNKLRKGFLPDKKAEKKLGKTLPEHLLDALSVETADLRAQGWSQPPASRKELYLRPAESLRPKRQSQPGTLPQRCTTRYILIGKPLPRVEDSIRIGELFRRAVMGKAKWLLGEDKIPTAISGHGLPKENLHRHAFYLPWDSDNDGRIDRLILHLPDGMDSNTQKIVGKLNRLWSREGSEWRLVLEDIGDSEAGGPLLAKAAEWVSVTPYLHPWHTKRGFDTTAQIKRECAARGLPEPVELTQLDAIAIGGQLRRPIHFHRFREKRGLDQPDRLGSLWRIRFPHSVAGPLSLGFGCHFGMGSFLPLGLR